MIKKRVVCDHCLRYDILQCKIYIQHDRKIPKSNLQNGPCDVFQIASNILKGILIFYYNVFMPLFICAIAKRAFNLSFHPPLN